MNDIEIQEKATPNQALPLRIFETGLICQRGKRQFSPLTVYTGGCPSAVERPTEPVFWQLMRVRVYAGVC